MSISAAMAEPVPTFGKIEDGHHLIVPQIFGALGIRFVTLGKRGEMFGVFSCRSDLPGNEFGYLVPPEPVELSNSSRRDALAGRIAKRGQLGKDVDVAGLLDRLYILTEKALHIGDESLDLAGPLEDEHREQDRTVCGFPLAMDGPNLVFGDGGSGKSMFALKMAGELAREGVRVALLDWEWKPGRHQRRLRKLFGEPSPSVRYLRCAQFGPLTRQVDRVRRFVQMHGIQFVIVDSAAPASGRAAEQEDVTAFYAALESLGDLGSLILHHVTKAEGADKSPFGSAYWRNGARRMWYLFKPPTYPGDTSLRILLEDRKANDGTASPPIAFEFDFSADVATFAAFDPAVDPDMCARQGWGARLLKALQHGNRTREELRAALPGISKATFRQELKRARDKGDIVELPDKRISLMYKGLDTVTSLSRSGVAGVTGGAS